MVSVAISNMTIINITLIIVDICVIVLNIAMIGKENKKMSNNSENKDSLNTIPSEQSFVYEKGKPLVEDSILSQREHPETAENQHLETNDIASSTKEKRSLLSFALDLPKIENEGEDAPPLLIASNNEYVIGVFDGMGGAGAEVYQAEDQIHTGAYFASRTAKDIVEQFVLNENAFNKEDISNSLKEKLKNGLKKKRDSLKGSHTMLVSKMIKTLPTTMAISFISTKDDIWQIKALWTGDSRIYLLSPDTGLIQLTKDDLSVDQDPFQNLYNDSSLNNMVNLSQDFSINVKVYETKTPCIILAASDGCFGYLPSPMHFEELLLGTMSASGSISEWRLKLNDKLKEVAGDDCSMALVCSTSEYNTLKSDFKKRHQSLSQEMITIDKEIKETTKAICEKHWNLYKQNNYPF